MEIASILNSLREERAKLDEAIAALEKVAVASNSSAMGGTSGKRQMSAAGRAAIIAAQKRRWAKFRAKK